MMRFFSQWRRRRQARADQRGAAMVELAFLAIPLVLLSLGAFEMGLAWQDSLAVNQATRTGARSAANLSVEPTADQEALRSLVGSLNDDELAQVQVVSIYLSDEHGAMPAGCDDITQPVPADCNRYEPAELADLDDPVYWSCGGASHDANWCPTTRVAFLDAPMYIGISVRAEREYLTGLMPSDTLTIRGTTVMRVDPKRSP